MFYRLEVIDMQTAKQRVKLGEQMKQRAQKRHEHMQRRGAASAPSK